MTKYKSLIVPLALSIVLMVICTLVEGSWTERWAKSDSEELNQWSSRVNALPATIGEWDSKDLPQNQAELDAAGITGSVSREYVNRNTGDRLSVFLVVGGARKIAVHTPDKCFVAGGYKMARDPEKYDVADQSTFYNALFTKEGVQGNEFLRVFWGWKVGPGWQAPDMPRWDYRGKEALFKMYLMTSQANPDEGPDKSVALEFMKEAKPIIESTLFPDQATPAPAKAAEPAKEAPKVG